MVTFDVLHYGNNCVNTIGDEISLLEITISNLRLVSEYVHTYTHIYTYLPTYIHIYIHTYKHTYACVYMSVGCVHMFLLKLGMHTYIHPYINTYIHAYTFVNKYIHT